MNRWICDTFRKQINEHTTIAAEDPNNTFKWKCASEPFAIVLASAGGWHTIWGFQDRLGQGVCAMHMWFCTAKAKEVS